MFNSRKDLLEKVQGLEGRVSELETENTELSAKVASASNTDESLAALNEDLEAAKTQITEQDAKISALGASLEAEKAKTTPDAIQALITAQIAGSGHPPLAIEGEEKENESVIPKSRFDQMSPTAKMAFVKSGGKLTD